VPTLATASVAPSPAPSGRALPSPAPPGTYLAPLSGSRAVLAPDGSAAHAVLADVKAQRMSLWSSSGAQVVLDIPIYFAGFDQPASRFVPGGPLFDLEWRGGTTLLHRPA